MARRSMNNKTISVSCSDTFPAITIQSTFAPPSFYFSKKCFSFSTKGPTWTYKIYLDMVFWEFVTNIINNIFKKCDLLL